MDFFIVTTQKRIERILHSQTQKQNTYENRQHENQEIKHFVDFF